MSGGGRAQKAGWEKVAGSHPPFPTELRWIKGFEKRVDGLGEKPKNIPLSPLISPFTIAVWSPSATIIDRVKVWGEPSG